MSFVKKALSIILAASIVLSAQMSTFAASKPAEPIPFDFAAFQGAATAFEKECSDKKILDTTVIVLNNELIRLNKELIAKKTYTFEDDLKATLNGLEKAWQPLNSKNQNYQVLAKKNAKAKTNEADILASQKRLISFSKNLHTAMVHFGIKPNDKAKAKPTEAIAGGYGKSRAATADETAIFNETMKNTSKDTTYDIVSVSSQVVAGTNYCFNVKVTKAKNTYDARIYIFQPLPYTGEKATFVKEEKVK